MKKSKLELEFKDEMGKKFTLSIDEPRDDLTPGDIKDTMEEIVDKSIFATATGDVIALEGARYITTTVEEVDIQ